jgi:hypothetical protein
MSHRPSLTDVGAAILATLRGGSYASEAIRAALSDGAEVRPPAVLVTAPSIGFEELGEGQVLGASEWGLQLYSNDGRSPSVGVDLAFADAVIATLHASPTLGGVVAFAYLLGVEEPIAVSTGVREDGSAEPPTMYRRAMRLHVNH